MKLIYIVAALIIFFKITNAHAENSITFEQYKKGILFKLDVLSDSISKVLEFKKNKRPLTTKESSEHMCSVNGMTRETLYYINKHPKYKEKIKLEEIQKIEDAHQISENFIKKFDVKCPDTVEIPAYYPGARWQELPSIQGKEDPVIAYIDTDNYRKHSPIPDSEVVNIKELFKTNPDYYIEQDYLIFCKTKEYITTRVKAFVEHADGTTTNYELKDELPLTKEPMGDKTKRIFDYKCE
jgi:hypothetical protein